MPHLHLRPTFFLFLLLLAAGNPLLASLAPKPPGAAEPLVIKKEGTKFGLVTKQGKQVLPARYDSLQYTRHNEHYIAYLRQTGAGSAQQAGLINAKGKELIPIRYAAVTPISPKRYAVTDARKKVALYNEFGEPKTPFQFDEITAFYGKLARFYQGGRAGVLDDEGTIRLEALYQDVVIHSDQTVDALPLRKWIITDGNNKLLYTLEYDSIRPLGADRWAATTRFYDSVGRPTTMTALTDATGTMLVPYRAMHIDPFEGGVARVRENKKFGLLDLKGTYLLAPEWDSLAVVQGTVVAGMRAGRNWNWHLFDLKGKKLSRHTYQNIVPLAEGPMPAKREGRWGYIDHTGSEMLLCRYDTTFAFTGELARVRYNGLEGVINKEGLWQIRPLAEHITILDPYRFLARLKHEYQLLNEKGELLYSTTAALKPLVGGLAEINAARQWSLLDINGRRLSPADYSWISDVQEGTIFFATKEGRRGILSRDGRRFIAAGPETWNRLYDIHEGFIGAQIGRQQGFVDTNGKLRIANRYDTVTYFSDGMAAVAIRGKWGYVDKIERLLVQPLYDAAAPFWEGSAIVSLGGRQGIINKKGERILALEYDRISRLSNGRLLLQQGGLYGLADGQGNRIVSPKYDTIQDLENGYLLVGRGGKRGLLSIHGVSTIPLMYDVLVYDPKNELYLCTHKREGPKRINLKQ
jgi:hypothetical protein